MGDAGYPGYPYPGLRHGRGGVESNLSYDEDDDILPVNMGD